MGERVATGRPLRVTFEGEEGAGPGVTKEFFQASTPCVTDSKTPDSTIASLTIPRDTILPN